MGLTLLDLQPEISTVLGTQQKLFAEKLERMLLNNVLFLCAVYASAY